jgi:predicted thioesterase
MKSGLQPGQTAQIEFQVDPVMSPQFAGKVVHRLLSTTALGHQMEWAARQTILPYLEEHEEGIGARLLVHHHLLTPVGMTVKVTARVTSVKDNKVDCDIEACTTAGVIATGTVLQAIVARTWIEEKSCTVLASQESLRS